MCCGNGGSVKAGYNTSPKFLDYSLVVANSGQNLTTSTCTNLWPPVPPGYQQLLYPPALVLGSQPSAVGVYYSPQCNNDRGGIPLMPVNFQVAQSGTYTVTCLYDGSPNSNCSSIVDNLAVYHVQGDLPDVRLVPNPLKIGDSFSFNASTNFITYNYYIGLTNLGALTNTYNNNNFWVGFTLSNT